MGRRARELRSKVKRYARLHGFKEDEYGELRHRMSKAEARLRFASHVKRALDAFVASALEGSEELLRALLPEARSDILARMIELATTEMQAIEDALVFA